MVCDETVNAVGDSGDYTTTFQDVMPILAKADLACLNFEGILARSALRHRQRLRPEAMLTALKNAGVDVLQMANSKSIAGGISGLSAFFAGGPAGGSHRRGGPTPPMPTPGRARATSSGKSTACG